MHKQLYHNRDFKCVHQARQTLNIWLLLKRTYPVNQQKN